MEQSQLQLQSQFNTSGMFGNSAEFSSGTSQYPNTQEVASGGNESQQMYRNRRGPRSRNGLSEEQRKELIQLLSSIENLNPTKKMIRLLSDQRVSVHVLLYHIQKEDLKDIKLLVGPRALLWTAIVRWRKENNVVAAK